MATAGTMSLFQCQKFVSLFVGTILAMCFLAPIGLASMVPRDAASAALPDETVVPDGAGNPLIVPLTRESIPIHRKGKVVSFKTSYSGILKVGFPEQQEFRVVFDTGSGHVVVPSTKCESETCVLHRRYNESVSTTAVAINVDGKPVASGKNRDQVTIGFGTGKITGEFVRDTVCLESSRRSSSSSSSSDTPIGTDVAPQERHDNKNMRCAVVNVVVAKDMSPQPFKRFTFDGILGLGLASLALSNEFSFFETLTSATQGSGDRLAAQHFGVFLGDDNEDDSEIALGGHNPKRLVEPLSWVPVAMADLGYWQVEIRAIRINGQPLDMCDDGTCRGIMDTGTSHLGIPGPYDQEISKMMTTVAPEDLEDCRYSPGSVLEIELPGVNITLYPEDYMRKLPLDEGIQVGSKTGVTLDDNKAGAAVPETTTTTTEELVTADEDSRLRYCRPKFMAVNLPAPLGPKLFILGEPVLHRYYSVYDWQKQRIGVGISSKQRLNSMPGSSDGAVAVASDSEASEDSIVLMQASARMQCGDEDGACDDDEEETVLMQLTICVSQA